MADDVVVTITDQTTPISREGFGLPLIFDNATDADYQEVESTDEITTFTSGDAAYDMAAKMFEQEPSPQKVALYGVDVASAGSDITTELDNLALENDDFYFLLSASRTQADLEECASWAGSNDKLFVGQPDITEDVTTITTIASNMSSDRAVLFAHDGGDEGVDQFIDAAIVGRIAPTDPGQATWKFKNLNGVNIPTYSNVDKSDLLDGNVNSYEKVRGVNQTNDGITTAGGYADIQRSKDWLTARIAENVFFLLHNADKVPYDDPGIAQVVSKLKGVLKTAVDRRVIAIDANGNGLWTVSFPQRSEIADSTISNRILPDIEFTATVAGAIHKVEIDGVLQV